MFSITDLLFLTWIHLAFDILILSDRILNILLELGGHKPHTATSMQSPTLRYFPSKHPRWLFFTLWILLLFILVLKHLETWNPLGGLSASDPLYSWQFCFSLEDSFLFSYHYLPLMKYLLNTSLLLLVLKLSSQAFPNTKKNCILFVLFSKHTFNASFKLDQKIKSYLKYIMVFMLYLYLPIHANFNL